MTTTTFFQNQFYGKSILKETDLSVNELNYLVDYGLHLKGLAKQNIHTKLLADKNIALIFEKNSARTLSAFTTAANKLVPTPFSWARMKSTYSTRNRLKIPLRFWVPCTTPLNSVASVNQASKL
ncbi:Ornithine carbamoyltransferase (ArgF) [Fructobacillus cardui]|nr:Ornithine carbamoyltransferase (ArgF) [Fructobacillus cardui]